MTIMSKPPTTVSAEADGEEQKDPSGRRQEWADISSGGERTTTTTTSSTSTDDVTPSSLPNRFATSFRLASNRFIDGSGDLDVQLHRASLMARQASSVTRRRPSSASSRNLSGSLRRGSAFSNSNRSLVALTQQEVAGGSDDNAGGISSFLAMCLTANFISVGYLFVPYAFATTGLLLTSVIFLMIMLQSFITCTYVMDACARAEILAAQGEENDKKEHPLSPITRGIFVRDENKSLSLRFEESLLSEDFKAVDVQSMPIQEADVEDELSSQQKNTINEQDGILGEISEQDGILRGITEHDGILRETGEPCGVLKADSVVNEQDGVLRNMNERDGVLRDDDVPTKPSESRELNDPAENKNRSGDESKWWYKRTYIASEKPTDHLKKQSGRLSLPAIGDRKFELPELSRIFLGETWRIFFTITICFDLYGITWSVASVFGSSLASEFSMRDNQDDYMLFIAIFAAIVVPMSFLNIVDQLYAQLLFFIGRMFMVTIMLATTAVASSSRDPHFGDQGGPQRTSPLADFRTLHLATQICVFATSFQFSVPVIAEAVEHKSSVRRIYGGSTSIIAISVLILSLLLASFFGSELMEESSNLNWAVYHGGTGRFDEEIGDWVDVAWWARFLSKYVVIYPAIDGISTFVLCAVSLGEIIMGSWYGSSIHELESSWKRRLVFRLLGSVPQLIGAAFVRDISVIATYAGLFTVASYIICPCLLQIFSSRIIKQAGLTSKTQYTTIFSNELTAWTVACLGTAMIFYAIIGSAVIEV